MFTQGYAFITVFYSRLLTTCPSHISGMWFGWYCGWLFGSYKHTKRGRLFLLTTN